MGTLPDFKQKGGFLSNQVPPLPPGGGGGGMNRKRYLARFLHKSFPWLLTGDNHETIQLSNP